MTMSAAVKKSSCTSFVLVYILALPFWLLGALAGGLIKVIPINLPISALMFVCPITAAVILTYREQKSRGVKQLLSRIFDYKRTRQKKWYVPTILLMPAIMVLSYGVMRLLGMPLPKNPYIPFQAIPIFLLVFFISAIGEEVGWSGYAIDPLQDRWSALQASLIVGSVLAIWHVVPYIQAHNAPAWIAWQCLGTVGLRVLIVWLYNNAGKSVFVAILFHITTRPSLEYLSSLLRQSSRSSGGQKHLLDTNSPCLQVPYNSIWCKLLVKSFPGIS